MYSLASSLDERTCSYLSACSSNTLYVTVELPTTHGERAVTSVNAMLAEVCGASAGGAEALPAIAQELGERLARATRSSELPEWVFFAGVSCFGSSVVACVAGPHRVHLLCDGVVVASTREHILKYDEPPPDWPDDLARTIDRGIHGAVVTRSVGTTASRSAEVTIWRAPDEFQILVVSADYHQYRGIASYVDRVHTKDGEMSANGTFALISTRRDE